MSASVLAANLGAWCLQSAALLGAALLLPELLRIREPRFRLALAHASLGASVVLPLLQPVRESAPSTGLPAFRLDLLVMAGEPSPAAAWSSALGWLLAAIALVALGRLAWLAAGLLGLGRMRSRAVPLDPEPFSAAIARGLAGVRAPLLGSAEVTVPSMVGVLRPAVLVPPSFTALPFVEQRAVLCHEFLHVARGDGLALLAEEVLRALLWFHPAIWLVLGRAALWREQAVDAEAVRLTGDRRSYLQALSGFAHASAPAAAAALPFHRPGHLLRRMALLVKEVPMKKNPWFTAAAGSAAVTLLLGVGALAVRTFPLSAAVADDTVYKVGGEVKAPVEISRTQPKYPEEARKSHLEGQVIVEAVIDQEGRVASAKVLKSPDELLSQASIEAVRTWVYKPATRNGQPVKVLLSVTVTFKLS